MTSPQIYFARTRYVYDPYRDFYRLAELSGFPIIYLDEIDFSEPGVYITSPKNGEWAHFENEVAKKKQRNAHIIWWCLERPANIGGGGGSLYEYARSNRSAVYARLCDEVWVSDPQLATETGLRYVVLGSHPALGIPGNEKSYDFTHQSYDGVPRRGVYYHKSLQRFKIGPNAWNPERDAILKASKFGLAVHQDQHPFQEPLRMALFAAYGLPIVMETCTNPYPWSNDETAIIASLDDIPGLLSQVLRSGYAPWREMGQRAREMMCNEFEFGKMVRLAVEQSTGDWR